MKKGKGEHICGDCRNCTPDTEGPSFNVETGEFFMGTCEKGHGMGEKHKVFLHNETDCKEWQ